MTKIFCVFEMIVYELGIDDDTDDESDWQIHSWTEQFLLSLLSRILCRCEAN